MVARVSTGWGGWNGKGSQKAQTSNYKINKSWGSNVREWYIIVLYVEDIWRLQENRP